MKTTVTLLILLTIFSVNTSAQDVAFTTLEGHWSDVRSVSFSPDGSLLASGSSDDTIRLWDVKTGNLLHTLTGHRGGVLSVSFSPDGSLLASGSWDDTIGLWDVKTGNLLHTLTGHRGGVTSVSFSPDGSLLASGSSDDTIRLWDVKTGNLLHTLTGHRGGVLSVSFSPDGSLLASGSGDDTIRLWDVKTGKRLRTLTGHVSAVLSVSFSPDGSLLASGSWDDTIGLWDVKTGNLLHTLTGHRGGVLSVSFSPDGSLLASGSWDDTIGLWDVKTGNRLHTLTGHRDNVNSVSFSPDGSLLASGSDDNTIRLWEIPDTRVRITPDPVIPPSIGEQFTLNVNVIAGKNVGGYQVSLSFDTAVLRYVSSANGDYLPTGAFFVPPVVSDNKVTLGATAFAGESSGDGTLATITFEVVDVKESVIHLFDTILTDGDGEHLSHLPHSAILEPSLLTSSAIVSLTPSAVLSPAVGEQLTFNVGITGGQNVADFQLTVYYDQAALEYISSSRANYLPESDGMLETVTFEVLDVKPSTVSVSGYLIAPNGLRYTPTFESAKVIVPLLGDVNRDGVVNILDMVLVASKFGQNVSGDPADVNEDGVVNIVDLVKVAGALGGEAAAPSVWNLGSKTAPTRADVQNWLSQAQQHNLTDAISQRGLRFLEQLLVALTPKETALLPNYPNPFNPETWIPYQLAKASDVKISIYAADGKLVRTLALGHQEVGIYQSKSHAAHWGGRNAQGEPVASGVYFFTLTAGDFTATRKLLIRK